MNDGTRCDQLSPAGQHRRDVMRTELRSAALEHHARRRIRRKAAWSVAGVFLLTLSVWGVVLATSALRSAPPKQPIAHVDPMPTLAPAKPIDMPDSQPSLIRITRVSTTVDVSSVSISDEELLELLAKMGRRTGIARIDGKTILTQPVTDKEIARAQKKPTNSM